MGLRDNPAFLDWATCMQGVLQLEVREEARGAALGAGKEVKSWLLLARRVPVAREC